MENKVIFDSSVWLAFLLEADSQHSAAIEVFVGHQDYIFLVPEDILKEIVTVCKNRKQSSLAADFIEHVKNSEGVELFQHWALFKNTLQLFLQTLNTDLSFIDVSLLVLSKKYKVVTFDRNLQKMIEKKY